MSHMKTVEPTKSSLKMMDEYCSACLQSGKSVDAEKYCVECSSLLCEKCLQDHDKFPSLQSHKIVAKSEADSVKGQNSVECAQHYGQLVNIYCKDHDVVCCEGCLTMYHRSCKNVNQITDIASGNGESVLLRTAKQNLEKYLGLVKEEMDERNNNLTNLDKEKDVILQQIGRSEDELVKKIKELTEKSREEVSAIHAKHVKIVKSDIKALETVTSIMNKGKDKLDVKGLSGSEMFVHIKNCDSIVADVRNLVVTLYENWQKIELAYRHNLTLSKKILNAKSYGDVLEETVDEMQYVAVFNRKMNVKLEDDTSVCEIMGICIMENDTIVVTDFYNKRLKRLNKDGDMVDFIDLEGSPASLCKTGKEEVAAALRGEKRVQFITVGKTLTLEHSFETEKKCTGLGYDQVTEELYVSCGSDLLSSTVNVYNREGKLQRMYDKDKTEESIFKRSCQISLHPFSDTFYVADASNGVIAMSKTGEKLWTVTDRNIGFAWGIVKLCKEKLLVSDGHAGIIQQFGTNGKGLVELLGKSEGFHLPSVLCHNKQNSTLLVGGQSDFIKEYKLCPKQLAI